MYYKQQYTAQQINTNTFSYIITHIHPHMYIYYKKEKPSINVNRNDYFMPNNCVVSVSCAFMFVCVCEGKSIYTPHGKMFNKKIVNQNGIVFITVYLSKHRHTHI